MGRKIAITYAGLHIPGRLSSSRDRLVSDLKVFGRVSAFTPSIGVGFVAAD